MFMATVMWLWVFYRAKEDAIWVLVRVEMANTDDRHRSTNTPAPPPRCCPPHSHPPTSERQGFVHPWDAHPHHHHEHIHFVQEEIGEPTIVGVSRVHMLKGVGRGREREQG